MCPILPLGETGIHAYALFTWFGAAAACILALPALRRAGMTALQAWTALLLMCASFLVGARLWNVAVNPGNFLGQTKWYTLKLAGLSLYGGLIASAVALVLFTKGRKIGVLPVLDAMAAPGGIAFCFARLGCFLNGCCGGIATNGPFGVVFPDHSGGGQVCQACCPS
jgi:phosphatidylglycerol:prolipoprotein diacylglycerol transferase